MQRPSLGRCSRSWDRPYAYPICQSASPAACLLGSADPAPSIIAPRGPPRARIAVSAGFAPLRLHPVTTSATAARQGIALGILAVPISQPPPTALISTAPTNRAIRGARGSARDPPAATGTYGDHVTATRPTPATAAFLLPMPPDPPRAREAANARASTALVPQHGTASMLGGPSPQAQPPHRSPWPSASAFPGSVPAEHRRGSSRASADAVPAALPISKEPRRQRRRGFPSFPRRSALEPRAGVGMWETRLLLPVAPVFHP